MIANVKYVFFKVSNSAKARTMVRPLYFDLMAMGSGWKENLFL
jgi:hypothetical protein